MNKTSLTIFYSNKCYCTGSNVVDAYLHLQYFLPSQKMYGLWWSVQVFLYKKLLKKQRVYRNKLSIVCYTQNDCEQHVKSEQIKRKQTCSVCFVRMFKFQENKFKIIQNL